MWTRGDRTRSNLCCVLSLPIVPPSSLFRLVFLLQKFLVPKRPQAGSHVKENVKISQPVNPRTPFPQIWIFRLKINLHHKQCNFHVCRYLRCCTYAAHDLDLASHTSVGEARSERTARDQEKSCDNCNQSSGPKER